MIRVVSSCKFVNSGYRVVRGLLVEITRYDGESFLKVRWDSNHFGQFACLSSNFGIKPSRVIIPAGNSLEGLKLFSKGISEILRFLDGRCTENNNLSLPNGEEVGSRKFNAENDEGWRCYLNVMSSCRVEEEQKGFGTRAFIDSTIEKELERLPSHTQNADLTFDQDCMKKFDQVIKDNLNLFRRSIANKKFLHALNKGQILSFSGEVLRITREAMKSFEFIDAATIEGAKYPVYLAYAKEDMKAVLTHLCGVQD
ncbi:unnamed protein product [Cuscuta campestris]|uniref:Uncharacterized protein n=2 Tax=Cuscuta sect. Cleistogrammica TaxID=1824901 RepID=A0A484LTI2_9ASTE|nr:unnamed protein product [Cuscuta campestris]